MFSTRDAYGLRAIVELARHEPGVPLQSREIAARQDIPQAYLDQLLVSLRRAGLVKSVRGASGGYLLARPAEDLTVADVLRPLSSELFLNRWEDGDAAPTAITLVFQRAHAAALDVLAEVRISTLVEDDDAHRTAQAWMMHI